MSIQYNRMMNDNYYLHFLLIISIQHSRSLLVLGDIIAVMPTSSHLPRKLERFSHSQRGRMLILLICVTCYLAYQVISAVYGVTIIENLTFKVSASYLELRGQCLQECRFT